LIFIHTGDVGWYGLLVDVEVDWLVVKDPGDVWLAHVYCVMSRDVVEACWCLTIALVLYKEMS
jgi:hypothetical protein